MKLKKNNFKIITQILILVLIASFQSIAQKSYFEKYQVLLNCESSKKNDSLFNSFLTDTTKINVPLKTGDISTTTYLEYFVLDAFSTINHVDGFNYYKYCLLNKVINENNFEIILKDTTALALIYFSKFDTLGLIELQKTKNIKLKSFVDELIFSYNILNTNLNPDTNTLVNQIDSLFTCYRSQIKDTNDINLIPIYSIAYNWENTNTLSFEKYFLTYVKKYHFSFFMGIKIQNILIRKKKNLIYISNVYAFIFMYNRIADYLPIKTG